MTAVAPVFYSGRPAAQQPDRHFIQSLESTFAEPTADETVRMFAGQIAVLHGRSSSVSPTKNEARGMRTATAKIPQDFAIRSAPRKTERSLSEEIKEAMLADHGHVRARHKHIARLAGGVSPRTVEGWERGRSMPQIEAFLELGKHSPAIQKLTLRLWNLDPDLDPDAYRTFLELQRMVARR
jgi:hypothetical protein